MALRFRRTIKILPGIRVNLSRSGVSTSIGVRGAHVTVGHGKVRTTLGLPGSGLSYTQIEKSASNALNAPAADAETHTEIPNGKVWRGWLWLALLAVALIAALMAAA